MDLTFVEIIYPIVEMGTEQDLNKRHSLENRINELLGWTGLGHVEDANSVMYQNVEYINDYLDIDDISGGQHLVKTNSKMHYCPPLSGYIPPMVPLEPCVTSIEKGINKPNFILFPNPSSGSFIIVEDGIEYEELLIFNVYGNLVNRYTIKEFLKHGKVLQINEKGIFFV